MIFDINPSVIVLHLIQSLANASNAFGQFVRREIVALP